MRSNEIKQEKIDPQRSNFEGVGLLEGEIGFVLNDPKIIYNIYILQYTK